MTNLPFYFFFLIVLSAFAGGMMYATILALRAENRELKQKNRELQEAGPRRVPTRAAEMIMNGIAALNYVEFDLDDKKAQVANARTWFQRAMDMDKGKPK